MRPQRVRRPNGTYLLFPRDDRLWVVAARGNVYHLVGHADCERIAQLMADVDDRFQDLEIERANPQRKKTGP